MKENNSVESKMISRNWVLKRKRRKLPSGQGQATYKEDSVGNSQSRLHASSKRKLKNEIISDQFSSKKRGKDGYFYECVICDLGGNLLCCDGCPRTYHLQCLDPPLKRIPMGKWQCPSCSQGSNKSDPLNHLDSIAKRARTKMFTAKSKNAVKSSCADEVAQLFGNTFVSKKRSSMKGHSKSAQEDGHLEKKKFPSLLAAPCSSKPDLQLLNSSADGFSSRVSADEEKKCNSSPVASLIDSKQTLPVEEVSSLSGMEKPEANVIAHDCKSDIPSAGAHLHKMVVLGISAATEEIRRRNYSNSIKKKCRTEKGKYLIRNSKKSKLISNKLHKKLTLLNPRVPAPVLKDGAGHKISSVPGNDEKFSEPVEKPSLEHNKVVNRMDETLMLEDGTTVEALQVDRILGCRVAVEDTNICQLPVGVANIAPPVVMQILSDHTALPEVVFSGNNEDMQCVENNTKENQDVKDSDAEKSFSAENGEQNDDTHIKSVVVECDMESPMDASTKEIDVSVATIATGAKDLNDYAVTTENTECANEKTVTVETFATLRSQDDHLDLKSSEVLAHSETTDKENTECANEKTVTVETFATLRSQDDHLDLKSSEVLAHSEITDKENTECANEKTVTVETFATLRSQDDHLDLKSSEVLAHSEITDKEMDTNIGMSCAEDMVQEPALVESTFTNQKTVLYEFLVKWVGKSHIHNSWISESQVKLLAKRKLENYKAKYGTAVMNICEERWNQPQRVLSIRKTESGKSLAFVKWTGLPYDECTWESLEEPVPKGYSHLIDLFNKFESKTIEKDLLNLRARKSSEIVPLTEQPKELKGGSLFPHQLEALNWLRKCWCKSKNVILADEMGLGKTVSACAFLSSLYFEFNAVLPCLVLVPLSTMPNWLAEFASWAPYLNVVEYHGCAKARGIIRQYEWHASNNTGVSGKTAAYKFNVILTTYEMVLADSSHLRSVPWEVLVVDEGHRLKNSGSKLFSLLNTFSFQHRVLLTGTPLQNNIGEMYNLLNFLQPASFPSLSAFEEKFNELTTAEKVEELKKLVAPHMLRRLKKDAMQNIPPKTERMVPVELSSIQAEYYRAMLTKNYQILRNIGKGVPQQSMLNIVMQLRKVCNHPYLIPGTEPDSGSLDFLHEMRIKASAKLTLLHSMLRILYREGHRVLIFSQMTKLLDILEDYLTIEFGPKTYERVDGSVSVADRQASITRFNQDKSRFVFLLSTRSCGLGINLATADTVIIYDSDFNPHADIQAMNRAHRIGQSKRLLVYRLVVRASVEERILQLAKKKLMLDQLFVNKSGSQKEVEDILKWGTEELFSDPQTMMEKDNNESVNGKDEPVIDTEHKHRRRTGGLGDVYQDKCTDGNNKIIWDENAISRLLDRSNLQECLADGGDGDSENDMLGSVKSIEWNDETAEEQGANEATFSVTEDPCGQNSFRKDDSTVAVTEENEWDKLLRLRWEKYQSEEEAALGRGKRQRKAVSYREAYAPHANETLSEGGADEEREPEPVLEYTPAGRALKEKFAKLRARQKERLAQRNAVEPSNITEVVARPESLPRSPTNVKPGDGATVQIVLDEGATINMENTETFLPHEIQKSETDHISRINGRLSKHKIGNLEISASPYAHAVDPLLPSHYYHGTSSINSAATNLLPFLGLRAPISNHLESLPRNISSGSQSRLGSGPEFPFSLPPCPKTLSEAELKGLNISADNVKLPDPSSVLQQCSRFSLPSESLPFPAFPPAMHGKAFDHRENSSARCADFQERMTLPNLPEKLLARFPLAAKGMTSSPHDFLPSLSLSGRLEDLNSSMHKFPLPLLPNLKLPSQDVRNNQSMEVPTNFGLGQVPTSSPSFPENHRKVLENIMMRTGSKRKSKVDGWSEDELDSLWIGVRRHGRGDWANMLRDPRLKFSKYKTPEILSLKWEEEEVKLLHGSASSVSKPMKMVKHTKSSPFPSISDGVMERALHASRLAFPKLQSHLTDMTLGIGDPQSSRPNFKSLEPFSCWNHDGYRATFLEDTFPDLSNRPGTSSNVSSERPFLLNSLGASYLGPQDLNSWGNFRSVQQKEHGHPATANKHGKLPDLLDRSFNSFRNCSELGNGGSACTSLPLDTRGPILAQAMGEVSGSGTSATKDKLPHWLRDAVKVPSGKPPEPELPPTVSAIAQSVRMLYGEDNPAIPPFVVPGPPPTLPKDPRRSLRKKKKRRQHRLMQVLPDIPGSSSHNHLDQFVSRTISLTPAPLGMTSSTIESDVNHPYPPLTLNEQKRTSHAMSPSPEVLKLVASCVASGYHDVPAASGTSSYRYLEGNPPFSLPRSLPEDKLVDNEDEIVNKRAAEKLPSNADCEDSSKTYSDPCRHELTVEEDISSEGTVSDHPAISDKET